MPKNSQNTISQTELKHYNTFIGLTNEAIRCLQTTTYTGNKLKFETTARERDQESLVLITIDVLKTEQQNYSDEDIITLLMTQIINSSFNKHSMSWELIHHHILQPSDSDMKEMCCHQTLAGIPE